MAFQIHRDMHTVSLSIALLIFTGALVWHGNVSWETATAFLTGALTIPGFISRKVSKG